MRLCHPIVYRIDGGNEMHIARPRAQFGISVSVFAECTKYLRMGR